MNLLVRLDRVNRMHLDLGGGNGGGGVTGGRGMAEMVARRAASVWLSEGMCQAWCRANVQPAPALRGGRCAIMIEYWLHHAMRML